MFIWLRLAHGEPMEISRAALAEGVAVVPGQVFYHDQNTMEPALRLNFSYAQPDVLRQALYRLRKVLW